MPNKDGTGNALDGIKRIGIAALCFAPLVFIGTRLEPKWWHKGKKPKIDGQSILLMAKQ